MIKRRISPRIIIESELINHPSCYFINIIKILKQKDLSLERSLTRGKNSLNGNTCVENYYNKSIKSVYIKICEVVVLRLTYGITIRLITLTISNIAVTFLFYPYVENLNSVKKQISLSREQNSTPYHARRLIIRSFISFGICEVVCV